MKINIAQLNPMPLEGAQLDKILLSQDGAGETVDFQSVLQSLLGLQLGDFPGNQGEMPPTPLTEGQPGMRIASKPVDSALSMPTLPEAASIAGHSQGVEPQLVRPTQELSQMMPHEPMQEIPQGTGEAGEELASWVKSSLEKDVQILVEGFQSEMQITEIEETTQADSVEYTMKSYETLKRLKWTGREAEEVQSPTRGWERSQQPEQSRAAEHTNREEAAAIGLKSDAASEAQGRLLRKSSVEEGLGKVEGKLVESHPDQGIKTLEGMMREVPKAAKGQAAGIENTEEVKQAFFESIRETQSSGASKVTIKLNPKELGQMEVELKLQDGAIQGEIKVVSAQLKEQAQQILIPVKEALVQEQFAVRDIQITVMSPEHQQSFGEQGWQHHGQHPQYASEQPDEETIIIPEDPQTGMSSEKSGINLLA